MTLSEMAVEYRKSAELLRTGLKKLKLQLETENLCEMDRLRLRRRILRLEAMLRDTAATAYYLENYYGGKSDEREEAALKAG